MGLVISPKNNGGDACVHDHMSRSGLIVRKIFNKWRATYITFFAGDPSCLTTFQFSLAAKKNINGENFHTIAMSKFTSKISYAEQHDVYVSASLHIKANM